MHRNGLQSNLSPVAESGIEEVDPACRGYFKFGTSTSALNQQNLEPRQATSTYTMAHQVTLDVSASAITNLHWVITINEELDHITNGLEIITDGSLELLCNLKLVVWKGLTSVFGRHSSYDTTCILSQFKRIWQRPTFFILQNGHVDQMRLPWSWHIVCLWDGLQSLLKIWKNIRYFSLCAYLLKRSVLTPIYLPV